MRLLHKHACIRIHPFNVSCLACRYMVEELLCDEELLRGGSSRGPASLPHDFKFWMFGATIAHVTVVCDRRRTGPSSYEVSIADCDASFKPQPTWCTPGDDANGRVNLVSLPPQPECWDDMVATASMLGEAVGAFCRVDFYATARGPIFGEFQMLFDLVDWNANADRAIRKLWRGRNGAG